MQVGKLNPLAKINFPGFQEILDFTATGSESSVSVTVDGDTDKEYIVDIRNTDASNYVYFRLNADSGANYGYHYIANVGGTISAARATGQTFFMFSAPLENAQLKVLSPSGLIKTCFELNGRYSSGTTMARCQLFGHCYNSTSNITSLDFSSDATEWTAGTRIYVGVRRA